MQLFGRYQHWIITFLFLGALLWGSLRFASFKKGQWEADIRSNTQELLISKKSSLEKALYSRIYYTRGVAAFVSLTPNITNSEFTTLARQFIKSDTVIGTMSLSRNCVINAIYPLKGHEEAIGLDLLNHPERKDIVQKTIETHKTFLAGPVELVEGGVAFISYTPIFKTTENDEGEFWGLTDIVIKRDAIFHEANIHPIFKNFEFALRGEDGKGSQGKVFWGNPKVFDHDPVIVNIDLPSGYWELAAVPQVGWGFYNDQDVVLNTVLIIGSLIISILLFIILKAMSRIRKNAREFKAIFNSLDTLILELSSEGEYLKVAPTNIDLLVLSPKEIIGKKVDEIFEADLAALFMDAIRRCLQTRKVVVIDYPLEVRGKSMWFIARISYKSEKSVIYNAYDITNIKKAENELKESEERLAKLNAVKDRFFSIVAHDLRNPVGSFSSVTELLLSSDIENTPEEANRLLKSLNQTADGLMDLLENLLSWTMTQQGQIEIFPESQSVKQVCDSVIASQVAHALVKKITLKNRIDTDHYAFFDPASTRMILRNLISNAIKFSNQNSEITVSSDLTLMDGKEFLLIHVKDQGTGIPADKLDGIFNLDNDYKTRGTKNEKGSGLGLVLCREFVEMQNGKIWATSEVQKGSTFTFSLPV